MDTYRTLCLRQALYAKHGKQSEGHDRSIPLPQIDNSPTGEEKHHRRNNKKLSHLD